MRTGKEKEEWERLSYHLATLAAFKGAKRPKVETFNKFNMENVSSSTTVSELEGIKREMLNAKG